MLIAQNIAVDVQRMRGGVHNIAAAMQNLSIDVQNLSIEVQDILAAGHNMATAVALG